MKKDRAIAFFGTQSAIAAALRGAGYRISQPAVSKWGEVVPEVPARILSELSGGELLFEESLYRDPADQPGQEVRNIA